MDAVAEVDLAGGRVGDGGDEVELGCGVAGWGAVGAEGGEGGVAGDDAGTEGEEVFIDEAGIEELSVEGGAAFEEYVTGIEFGAHVVEHPGDGVVGGELDRIAAGGADRFDAVLGGFGADVDDGLEVGAGEEEGIQWDVAGATDDGGDGRFREPSSGADGDEFGVAEAGRGTAGAEGGGAVEDDVRADAEFAHEALVDGGAEALFGALDGDFAIGGHDHVDVDVGAVRRWVREVECGVVRLDVVGHRASSICQRRAVRPQGMMRVSPIPMSVMSVMPLTSASASTVVSKFQAMDQSESPGSTV